MNKKSSYKTDQKEKLLEYMQAHADTHMTATDIYSGLRSSSIRIGITTVYRQLERLQEEGVVTKYVIDENTPACFEFTGHRQGEHQVCHHLKCVSCGKLIHLHCAEVTKLEEHIFEDHHFRIDPRRTLFYGYCEDCMKEAAV